MATKAAAKKSPPAKAKPVARPSRPAPAPRAAVATRVAPTRTITEDQANREAEVAEREANATQVLGVKIVIDRDVVTKIPKIVPPWHVPLYRSRFGDEKVIVEGAQYIPFDNGLPDAREEYIHLRTLFGSEANGMAHIELVYGRGREGIDRLQEAIDASYAGDVEAAQAVADGDADLGEEVAERRKAVYVDPATGETFEPDELPSMVKRAERPSGSIAELQRRELEAADERYRKEVARIHDTAANASNMARGHEATDPLGDGKGDDK